MTELLSLSQVNEFLVWHLHSDGCRFFVAADVIKSMDESVNPCDNFYQFACGGFVKSTVIPDDETEVTILGTLNDKVQEQVRILVEDPPVANESKPFTLIRNLYASCMNKCKSAFRINSIKASFLILTGCNNFQSWCRQSKSI